MVGGSVANIRFTNGFQGTLTPQLGYFIKNNWAIGGQVKLDVISPEGTSNTQTNWGVGAFTRYYFSDSQVTTLTNNGRFFGHAKVGFEGRNSSTGNTTNGVGLGIAAGYAYFITPNVALEAILGFEGIAGGGNTNFNGDVTLGVGFQIHLPNSRARAALRDQQ